MQIIHNKKSILQKIFSPTKPFAGKLKWSIYTIFLDVDEGCLVWNELTCVMVLLSGISVEHAKANPNGLLDSQELYKAAFLVPFDMDEGKRLKDANAILRKLRQPVNRREYTIFTTLGCNARCPYCFEKGAPHSTMNEKTAMDVVKFIQSRYDGRKVRLAWFGGEPLMNVHVIDLISDELTKAGVDFDSKMTSNGYLFNREIIQRAKENWNLKKVQITLDGTEEVYNRTKNYINTKSGNPFRVVLDNIDNLISEGMEVDIRMNISLENAEDIKKLVDQLGIRFAGRNTPKTLYATPLLEYFDNADTETSEKVYSCIKALRERIESNNLIFDNKILPKCHFANKCIADIDDCFTILPTGKIGKCEKYFDDDAVGDIWHGVIDIEGVARNKRRLCEQETLCEECLFAPSCTALSVCHAKCVPLLRRIYTFMRKGTMLNTYQYWKDKLSCD